MLLVLQATRPPPPPVGAPVQSAPFIILCVAPTLRLNTTTERVEETHHHLRRLLHSTVYCRLVFHIIITL